MAGQALADLVERDETGGAARARRRESEISSHATVSIGRAPVRYNAIAYAAR
jgi:hypothetical protein